MSRKMIRTPEGEFYSALEYSRWRQLNTQLEKGMISNLERQVKYLLVPRQFDERGNLLEKAITYTAEFRYSVNGRVVLEDTKKHDTPDYIMKRKLMLYLHGIRLKEIE